MKNEINEERRIKNEEFAFQMIIEHRDTEK